MKLTRSLALAALATAFSTGAFAQLPTQKMLTVDVAETIAQESMAKCRAGGYKVTVTVVDGANVLKALLRDDGAGMATVDVGRLKANSVMAFGRPSGPPANLAPGAIPPAPILPTLTNAAGGVPI